MSQPNHVIARPQRWDVPFDPSITEALVNGLLQLPPFNQMDPEAFSSKASLRGILLNDCRMHNYRKGDIIIREGDYGHSAFIIMTGQAIVSLTALSSEVLGRKKTQQQGWLKAISQLWTNSRHPEARKSPKPTASSMIGSRDAQEGTRIFLQDIPGVLNMDKTALIQAGEVFGEISALTRTPRTATVVANEDSWVVEIRWQGFRELMKRDESIRKHVDQLYRENSLRAHLRETDLMKKLSDAQIQQVADATILESHGSFEWTSSYKSMRKEDVAEWILQEPVIAQKGDYVNGLLLIRNGFARLSRDHGDGHQTIAYLGKGEKFGFRELAHNWRSGEQRPWSLSLRAVGYVDLLRIPTEVVERLVLPALTTDELPPLMRSKDPKEARTNHRATERKRSMDTGLMEFLVEHRYINGTQAMMIDLDRCTRCDDCVRACATAHDNNPRFIRHGPKYDHWMIANACMHCLDPVCMIGCPTGAIGRDAKTGCVTINDQTCIGCSTCSNSCPYHNIRMVEISDQRGRPIVDEASGQPIMKATKCDLCVEQLGGPACQRACPHDALVRIDISTPDDITQWSQS